LAVDGPKQKTSSEGGGRTQDATAIHKKTQADIDRFLRLAEHVERAINAEIFYPNDNFMCGVCGYREMCGEW